MKLFVFEWKKPLGNYLIRWRFDFYIFSIRIHKWLCSDDNRAYHSHPTNMFSIILKGKYRDHLLIEGKEHVKIVNKYNLIRRNTIHYVEIIDKPTWTLLFTWGVPKRWSFWLVGSLKKKNRDKYFIEHGHHICN